MLDIDSYGVATLGTEEARECRGGVAGVVEAGIAIAAAAGAGFLWGYQHLGPVLNRYF
jgi:hypothetical protein